MTYVYTAIQIVSSILLWIFGVLLYRLVTKLIDIPGNGKLERLVETESEIKERETSKKKVEKTYKIILALLVMLLNVAIMIAV